MSHNYESPEKDLSLEVRSRRTDAEETLDLILGPDKKELRIINGDDIATYPCKNIRICADTVGSRTPNIFKKKKVSTVDNGPVYNPPVD